MGVWLSSEVEENENRINYEFGQLFDSVFV